MSRLGFQLSLVPGLRLFLRLKKRSKGIELSEAEGRAVWQTKAIHVPSTTMGSFDEAWAPSPTLGMQCAFGMDDRLPFR